MKDQRAVKSDRQALSPSRAFVVQFRGDRVTGRVEHVTSGQACRFSSFNELLEFFDSMLDSAVSASSPDVGICHKGGGLTMDQ